MRKCGILALAVISLCISGCSFVREVDDGSSSQADVTAAIDENAELPEVTTLAEQSSIAESTVSSGEIQDEMSGVKYKIKRVRSFSKGNEQQEYTLFNGISVTVKITDAIKDISSAKTEEFLQKKRETSVDIQKVISNDKANIPNVYVDYDYGEETEVASLGELYVISGNQTIVFIITGLDVAERTNVAEEIISSLSK